MVRVCKIRVFQLLPVTVHVYKRRKYNGQYIAVAFPSFIPF